MRKLLGAALAAALALTLSAPPGLAQTTGTYTAASGVQHESQGVELIGKNGSGQRCIVGVDAGCNAAAPSAAANLATGQVTVATSATLIAAARAGRQNITVVSNCTNPIEIGGSSGVTTSTGVILAGVVGASVTLNYSGALYAIGASSCGVSYYEVY